MDFEWNAVRYRIVPDDHGLNIIVKRIILSPGLGFARDKTEHQGRTSYHPTLQMALAKIATEGCRQIGDLPIDDVIAKLERIAGEFRDIVELMDWQGSDKP